MTRAGHRCWSRRAAATLWTIGAAAAAEHTLMPSPQTVAIGNFNAATKPALTIDSGDTVVIETAAAMEPAEIEQSGVVPASAVPQYVRDIYREVKDRGPGPHILTGPIFVNGAQPGDVLEVRILDIALAVDYGYNRQRPYNGALPEEFPGPFQRIIPINRAAKTAEIAPGVVVPLDHPFFGTMGLAPLASMGRIGSGPPGIHTGNIDNKDVAAGATLYMPVLAPGALFSIGDGHGAQGQGEVDLSAVETGLRGRFQFIVRKDMKITWPRAETADPLDRDGPQSEPRRGDEDRGARDHRFPDRAVSQAQPPGGLHDREHRGRLSRHPGGRRDEGHPRHDPEGDLRRAVSSWLSVLHGGDKQSGLRSSPRRRPVPRTGCIRRYAAEKRNTGGRTMISQHGISRRHMMAMSAAGGLALGSGIGRAGAQAAKRIEKLAPELDAILATDQPIVEIGRGFGGPAGPTEGPLWWKEGGYLLFSDINASKRMKYTPGQGITVFAGEDQRGERAHPRPPGPPARLRA